MILLYVHLTTGAYNSLKVSFFTSESSGLTCVELERSAGGSAAEKGYLVDLWYDEDWEDLDQKSEIKENRDREE